MYVEVYILNKVKTHRIIFQKFEDSMVKQFNRVRYVNRKTEEETEEKKKKRNYNSKTRRER